MRWRWGKFEACVLRPPKEIDPFVFVSAEAVRVGSALGSEGEWCKETLCRRSVRLGASPASLSSKHWQLKDAGIADILLGNKIGGYVYG